MQDSYSHNVCVQDREQLSGVGPVLLLWVSRFASRRSSQRSIPAPVSVCVCVCARTRISGMHVALAHCRGQRTVWGAGSLFHHMSPWDRTPVIRHGDKCLTLISSQSSFVFLTRFQCVALFSPELTMLPAGLRVVALCSFCLLMWLQGLNSAYGAWWQARFSGKSFCWLDVFFLMGAILAG